MSPDVRRLASRAGLGVKAVLLPDYPLLARRYLQASFSQSGEDRIVAFVFKVLGMSKPSYLDVGAYHPYHLSNTALLRLGGSRGINVEPDVDAFRTIVRHRKSDLNLNVGVGGEAGRLTFYRMSSPALNTFSRESAELAIEESKGRETIVSTHDVEIRTVADIIAQHGRCPDFMSLDVEGLDLEILQTMPSWPSKPSVLCVETMTYSEHGAGVKLTEIGDLLVEYGYQPFADTYLNTIFVDKDRWAAL
jgi:FkbM family methyltransferase